MKFAMAFAAAAILAAGGASAAPVTYLFEGSLMSQHQWDPIPEWQFAEGQKFHGELIYDPAITATSWDYIKEPDWTLTFHNSPLVSLRFTIELPGEDYSYVVPTQKLTNSAFQYVAVGDGEDGWNGVDIRTHNYPVNWMPGPPSAEVPESAYVGAYNPHMVALGLYNTPFYNPDWDDLLPDTSQDVDLAALHAKLIGPERNTQFAVRFSDSRTWDGERENLQAILYGRIDKMWVASVPEPQSWLLMIAGFGLVGMTLRTRTRVGIVA